MSDELDTLAREVDQQTRERYDERLGEFGEDPRTLGWDTRESQHTRFQAVADAVDLAGREVLDIGCGFADLRGFLAQAGVEPAGYRGTDLNPRLLEVARKRYPDDAFEARNCFLEPFAEPVADVGVMLGLLNFRLPDDANEAYTRACVTAAFAAVREALVVDFLSTCLTPDYPKEDFVHYHDPAAMLAWGLTLTPYASLKHDYRAIPQREFLLVLRKAPCGS